MSIGLALQTALTGLQTNQARTAVLSRNIANALTPGYTRKEAVLASLTVGGEGRGVHVSEIRRSVDASLARETRTQNAAYAAKQAQASILQTYTQLIGQPQEERSLSSAISQLETAFLALEDLPESPTQQRAVVDAAVNLTSRLNATSKAITDARQQADAGIAEAVTDINSTLKQLEGLNRQVAVRTGSGQDSSELQDQRDRLLDSLSEKVGIQYYTRDGNELVVLTSSGVPLLDGSARQLEFSPTAVVGPADAYPGGVLSGLTVDGHDIAPGGGYPLALKGGSLEGLFAIRDQVMPEMQRQVDEVAKTLINEFAAADATGGSLFQGTAIGSGTAGLAATIRVNSVVMLSEGGNPGLVRTGLNAAPGSVPVGDTTQLQKFIAVFTKPVSFSADAGLMTSGTIKNFTNAAISQQHAVRASAASASTSLNIQLETVRASREASEGVNVEEELQELIVLERTYAANAQIMQTAARMLDKLLEI